MKLTLAQIMSNSNPLNVRAVMHGLHKAGDTLTIVLPPGSALDRCGLGAAWIDAATEIVTDTGMVLKPVG